MLQTLACTSLLLRINVGETGVWPVSKWPAWVSAAKSGLRSGFSLANFIFFLSLVLKFEQFMRRLHLH